MSIETVLTEMTALRNELKSLTKIVRKIKAKQDDPTGEKSANRAKNNGFNREQKLRDLLEPPADVQVTFLNLQKFLSPHYTKVEA